MKMNNQYYLFCEAKGDEGKTIVKHTLDQPLSKKCVKQASYIMVCVFHTSAKTTYEKSYVIPVFGRIDYMDVMKHLEYTNSRRCAHVYKIDIETYCDIAKKVTAWRGNRKPTKFKDGNVWGKNENGV